MTTIVLADQMVRSLHGANPRESHTSPRRDWEDKRRLMERQETHFGPDGARSLWRGRIFSSGVRMFGLGARLLGAHARGRRNALDVRLAALSLSLSLIHISEPTRQAEISYAVFCL